MKRPIRTGGRGAAAGIAAILLAAATAGCGGVEVAPEPKAPLVSVASVASATVEDRIEATGELRAKQRAEIAAEVDGRVTALDVEEGDAVEEGQPLLRIDPERRQLELADARASVAQARSSLREAQRDVGRVEKLHGSGVASDAALDEARTRLAQAESQVAAAEARRGVAERALADATVAAPFAGLLARRHVSRGEYVRPGTPLFELVALDPVEVEFHLAERDSSRVRLGLPVAVRVAPWPDETFRARITFVAPVIEQRTRTLRVKAELANEEGRLRPGTFARVDLGVARREAVPMVPEEAVLQRADGQVVFRLRSDGTVERRLVETGLHRDGRIEVVRGVAAGDRVVTRGHVDLLDGARVRVAETAAARPVAGTAGPGEGS